MSGKSGGAERAKQERKLHGSEAACQLIGNLGTPKQGERQAIVAQREGGRPYVWTTLAVSNGEDYPPSWWFVNIFGVANSDDERPKKKHLKKLAEKLATGQRVRLQGRPEVRAGKSFKTEDGDIRKDVSVTLKLFMTPEQVLEALSEDAENAKGRRPVTFLPSLGDGSGKDADEPDMGF